MPASPLAMSSRRYMSKSQRACDFCRSRRAACRIEHSPPCRQCQLHSRDCTFEEKSAPRKSRRQEPRPINGTLETAREDPAQQHLQGSQPQPLIMVDGDGQYNDQTGHASNVVLEQATPSVDFFLDGNWALADPTLGEFSMDDRNPAAGAAHGLDDAVLEEESLSGFLAGLPHLDASPGNPHALDDDLVSHFVGPTSEQDPNLLRRYRFDDSSEIRFKKLATRITSDGPNPTLWTLSVPETPAESEGRVVLSPSSSSEEKLALEALVPPEVGHRLITL